jgi:hypothetical protein
LQRQDGPHNLIKFKITEPTPPWQAKSNRPNRHAQKQKIPLKKANDSKDLPQNRPETAIFCGAGQFCHWRVT